ncbi:DUF3703 domain-containing protein [Flavobacterium pedocola]
MKVYWKMPKALKIHFLEEIALSKTLFKTDKSASWKRLERAHIIGQPWALEHTIAHFEMLRFAFRIKNAREIIGQLPRLLVGGIKSYIGHVPTGNTGGANVPPLRKMEIPEDLQKILSPYL